MNKYVLINDLQVDKTYRHFKNKRFIITVKRRFKTSKGLNLVLEHEYIDEWQICLAKTYEKSKWEEISNV
jgi:hypothetical protein